MKLVLVFQTLVRIQLIVSGSRIYNLISTDKTIDHTPYNIEYQVPYPRCVSICSLNPECLSFDYTPANQYGQCNFYDVTFEIYQNHPNQSRILKTRPGVRYYSYLILATCLDWYRMGHRKDGVYEVHLLGKYKRRVYCMMEHADGGWLAFHRRFDGSVDFKDRNWKECKDGFGNPEGEYYLGNELLHLLTTSIKHDWLVRATDYKGTTKIKMIRNVAIGNESASYRINYALHDIDSTYSTVEYGQRMSGRPFSTHDRDNSLNKDCVKNYGPWWHSVCHTNAMNGPYLPNHYSPKGIVWFRFDEDGKNTYTNLKSDLIMIRPSSF